MTRVQAEIPLEDYRELVELHAPFVPVAPARAARIASTLKCLSS
jgi:hypothetical protein